MKKIIILTILIINFCLINKALAAESTTAAPGVPEAPNLQVSIPGMGAFSNATVYQAEDKSYYVSTTWLAEYLVGWYNYLIGIVGLVAVLVIAYGGVLWLIGNPGSAKKMITGAISGLILALAAYVILYIINRELVSFKAIELKSIPKVDISFTSGGGLGINLGQFKGGPSFTNNVDQYDGLLKTYADIYGIDCTLAKAHMLAESGGRPNLTSSAGAKGLMQLMPGTAKEMGVSNPFNPEQSIKGGIKYMATLVSSACNGSNSNNVCNVYGDIRYRIAAYNAGPRSNKASTACRGVTEWECSKNSGYAETRNYVNTVKANYQKLKDNGWGC